MFAQKVQRDHDGQRRTCCDYVDNCNQEDQYAQDNQEPKVELQQLFPSNKDLTLVVKVNLFAFEDTNIAWVFIRVGKDYSQLPSFLFH